MGKVFNAFAIGSSDFTVTYQKANDGGVATMTCNLFGPDRGATLTDVEYTASLVEIDQKALVPAYNLEKAGWRSFYQDKVINVTVGV